MANSRDNSENALERSHNVDLLIRSLPPQYTGPTLVDLVVDRAEQLRELSHLASAGLLSPEDLDHQRRRILGD
jgi:hypothetical protein